MRLSRKNSGRSPRDKAFLSREGSLGFSVLSNASSVSNRIPRFGGGEGGSRPSSSASQRTDSVKSGPVDVLSAMNGINSQNGPKPRLGMFSIRSDIRVAVADVYRGSVPNQKFESLHICEWVDHWRIKESPSRHVPESLP